MPMDFESQIFLSRIIAALVAAMDDESKTRAALAIDELGNAEGDTPSGRFATNIAHAIRTGGEII